MIVTRGKIDATGGRVPSLVSVAQWALKSRSIGSFVGFIDHQIRTCLLLEIEIISASGSGSSGSSCSNCVLLPVNMSMALPLDFVQSDGERVVRANYGWLIYVELDREGIGKTGRSYDSICDIYSTEVL